MRLENQIISIDPKNVVAGIHAAILKDDVHGNTIVVQDGTLQTRVKLSDLMSFLTEQAEFDKIGDPA